MGRSSCLVVRGTKRSLQSRGNHGAFLSSAESSAPHPPLVTSTSSRALPPPQGTAQDSHPQQHPRTDPSERATSSFELWDVFYQLSASLLPTPSTGFLLPEIPPSDSAPWSREPQLPALHCAQKNQYFRGFANRESCSRVIKTHQAAKITNPMVFNTILLQPGHHEVWQLGVFPCYSNAPRFGDLFIYLENVIL